jgi:hypothetical protein
MSSFCVYPHCSLIQSKFPHPSRSSTAFQYHISIRSAYILALWGWKPSFTWFCVFQLFSLHPHHPRPLSLPGLWSIFSAVSVGLRAVQAVKLFPLSLSVHVATDFISTSNHFTRISDAYSLPSSCCRCGQRDRLYKIPFILTKRFSTFKWYSLRRCSVSYT